MDFDQAGLEVLPREECLRLLSTASIGRVGFHSHALPVILPVAFALDGRDIVIRIRSGSQLDDATHDAVIAFEADGVDPGQGMGWSVAVTGMTEEITDPVELRHAEGLGLVDWIGDAAARFVRISTKILSGRRGQARATGHERGTGAPATDAASAASVAETHASVLFSVGERVYKLKKPVVTLPRRWRPGRWRRSAPDQRAATVTPDQADRSPATVDAGGY